MASRFQDDQFVSSVRDVLAVLPRETGRALLDKLTELDTKPITLHRTRVLGNRHYALIEKLDNRHDKQATAMDHLFGTVGVDNAKLAFGDNRVQSIGLLFGKRTGPEAQASTFVGVRPDGSLFCMQRNSERELSTPEFVLLIDRLITVCQKQEKPIFSATYAEAVTALNSLQDGEAYAKLMRAA